MNKDIYINGRFLSHKTDGISRFSFEICKGLASTSVDFTVIVPNWVEIKKEYPFKIVKHGNRKSHFWEQIDLPAFLKQANKPILVNLSGLGPLFYKNQIITIHDLSFYDHPKWFSLPYRWFYGLATPITARNAKVIITVSQFSKNEIIKYLKISPSKIFVVPNAVSADVVQSKTDRPHIAGKRKYILAVSSLDPRKNHKRLIEAFSHPLFSEYELRLVGKSASNFNIGNFETENQQIKFCGYVPDNELAVLYENAELFVYPSLYEGFGIPPLEAMSNDCVVVASNIESLKEVCGDAAVYMDPLDINVMRATLINVLGDSELRKQLAEKGKKRVTLYSWTQSVNELLKVLIFFENLS